MCIGLINLNAFYVTESERLQSRIYGLSIVRIHWNTLEGIQRMNRTVRIRLPTRTAVSVCVKSVLVLHVFMPCPRVCLGRHVYLGLSFTGGSERKGGKQL